ncbi:hypothetical protein A9179_19860 [Pseudomonas alcaligenes]|uniref:MSHA biogenesis protein MshK n=1 Tax=Aquipseudomonas alcaligenes TaxID=43263 RepID=A0ABR7S732_AQUAC|nr:hypothetical protein [Pseudomonas alcaligenes]
MLSGSAAAAVEIDPTQPPVGLLPAASAEAPAALGLQAILHGPSGSRVVIDGETLRVNDRHGDARVLAIYPHAVLIERQGQQQLLRLAEPVVKPSR